MDKLTGGKTYDTCSHHHNNMLRTFVRGSYWRISVGLIQLKSYLSFPCQCLYLNNEIWIRQYQDSFLQLEKRKWAKCYLNKSMTIVSKNNKHPVVLWCQLDLSWTFTTFWGQSWGSWLFRFNGCGKAPVSSGDNRTHWTGLTSDFIARVDTAKYTNMLYIRVK